MHQSFNKEDILKARNKLNVNLYAVAQIYFLDLCFQFVLS